MVADPATLKLSEWAFRWRLQRKKYEFENAQISNAVFSVW